MASQLAVISARARRLHRILSQAGRLTPASQAAKILEEAGEAAQAADRRDFAQFVHELADIIVACCQAALSADPDGLDILWQELAETLEADLARDWRATASGVIRHRPRTWSQADLDAIAAQSVTELRSPGRLGAPTMAVTVRARTTARVRKAVRAASAGGDLRLLASDLLARTRLAPYGEDMCTVDDASWDGHTLTVVATLVRAAPAWTVPHPDGQGS